MAYIWEGGLGTIPKYYSKALKQRLLDQYKQTWHTDIEASDRYTTYRSFKQEHKRAHYLTDIRVSKYRKLFTRMRFGITELNNNKRFTNPEQSRTCPFCTTDEDEEHFLLKCPTYNHLRHKYIAKHWITLNNVTVADLLGDSHKQLSVDTAIYIDRALRKREQMMQ